MRLSDFLEGRTYSPALHLIMERSGRYKQVLRKAPLKVYTNMGWKEVSQQAVAGALSGIAKREKSDPDGS